MLLDRARLHHCTRNAGFLWRVCGGIIAAATVIALAAHALRSALPAGDAESSFSAFDDWQERMEIRATNLAKPGPPRTAALATWLHDLASKMRDEAPEWKFDAAQWIIGDIELVPLLRRNTADEVQREMFADYTQGLLLPKGEARDGAQRRIQQAAERDPAVRFASGFHADLLMREGKDRAALAAYRREGKFEEARDARNQAFLTALSLGDAGVLRELCADPRYLREAGTSSVIKAARLIGDWRLMVRAVALVQWQRWSQSVELPLALLAASVWYVLLVYTGGSGPRHWLRHLAPVFAGVVSVWLLEAWQTAQRYGIRDAEQKSMTHEIIQWILYVGVPEETVKLALFALFLPLLLRRGSTAHAALTAGCVGLGFALDENLGYYLRSGGEVAIGRLVTANFLHIALTGVAGCWLYELVRSRFHRATEFITAFAGVCIAHGLYDFATTDSARWLGVDLAGVVVLALLAKYYFDLIKPDDGTLRRRTVSATAVFCVGSALLIGAAIVVATWQMNSLRGITAALRSVVSIFPVALIYVREFREV